MAETVYSHESVAEADAHAPVAHIEHDTNTGISNTKLAMWLFLASECLLFGGLITTYMLYRNPLERPDAGGDLRHPLHVDLVVRAADELAHHGARRLRHRARRPPAPAGLARRHRPARRHLHRRPGLRVHRVLREGLGFTTSRFSSAFYTLTGFHGVHVTVGIIMLMSMLFLSLRGKLPEHRSETVEVVGLYWHFVDVVWIFIFAVVYLVP